MKTDAVVEKLKTSFPTAACKTLRVSHHFHRLGDDESKTTKPDTSLATKTGHFHLLLTLVTFMTWKFAPPSTERSSTANAVSAYFALGVGPKYIAR
jgi:hypothetical protein